MNLNKTTPPNAFLKKDEWRCLLDWQLGIALGLAPVLCSLYQWLCKGHIVLRLLDWQRMLNLVLVSPVIEEILFRGYLQEWLYRYKWGKRQVGIFSGANVVTSVIFTSLHFFTHPPLWASLIFASSLIFGYFWDRHRNILSPVLLHGWYNFVYVTIS
jgi:membrane protease YdiL (CAAX protease family)